MTAPPLAENQRSLWDDNPLYSIANFFKYWKRLGLFSWLHIQTVLFWVILIVFIGYGPIYMIDHARQLEQYIAISSQFRPVYIIVTLSYFVIIFGNFLYLFDIYRQAVHAGSNSRALQNLYFASLLICLLCIIVCSIVVWDLHMQADINKIVDETELATFFIFIGLFIVDLLMMIAKVTEIRLALKEHADTTALRSLRSEKKFILNQMVLIDVPVLLGVWFIGLFTDQLDRIGFYFTSNNTFESFKSTFSVGAIGMHIIFSQFIFVFLNSRSLYRKIKQRVECLGPPNQPI